LELQKSESKENNKKKMEDLRVTLKTELDTIKIKYDE
jgi:hypothetical protein